MLLLWILVLVLGIAYLAHRRTAPLPALGVVAVYLLAMGAFSHAPGWLLLVFWVLIAVVAAPRPCPPWAWSPSTCWRWVPGVTHRVGYCWSSGY